MASKICTMSSTQIKLFKTFSVWSFIFVVLTATADPAKVFRFDDDGDSDGDVATNELLPPLLASSSSSSSSSYSTNYQSKNVKVFYQSGVSLIKHRFAFRHECTIDNLSIGLVAVWLRSIDVGITVPWYLDCYWSWSTPVRIFRSLGCKLWDAFEHPVRGGRWPVFVIVCFYLF